MTENEARTIDETIENLKYDYEIDMYIHEIAPKIAVWLEELKSYRAIGTVEEFKALKEKAEPKKIAYQIGKNGLKHEKCPTCGSFQVFGNYCTCCGQRLDWKMKREKQ